MFPRFDRSAGRANARRVEPDRDDQEVFADLGLPGPGPVDLAQPGGSGERTTPGAGEAGSGTLEAADRQVSDPRTVAAILRSAPDAVVLFDTEGSIVEWSPAAERMLGYHRGEAVGRDLLTLAFPPRLHDALRGVFGTRGSSWGEAAKREIEVAVTNRAGEEIEAGMTLSWAPGPELFAMHLTDGSLGGGGEKDMAKESRRRAATSELARTAMGHGGIGDLLTGVARSTAEYAGCESCEIWDLDAQTGELVLRRALGPRYGKAAVGTRIRPALGSRLAGALGADGPRIVLGDRTIPDPMVGPDATEPGSRPGVVAIVHGSEGAVLGAITGLARPGFSFSTAETSHLNSLSAVLGIAIERDSFVTSITTAERRLRTVIENLPAITYTAGLGVRGRWHFVSPQVEEIFGFTVEECLSDPTWWERQVHPGDLERVVAAEEHCGAAREQLDVEYRMRDRSGRTLWIRDRASIGRSEDGEILVEGLLLDITAHKQAEERLQHLADHDHLTGLLNRRRFEEQVNERIAADPSVAGAIAVLDIDRMKLLNDALGHAAGDAVLSEIAASLEDMISPGQLLARLSSDEFALYMPGLDQDEAERLVGALAGYIRRRQARLALTASAGIAMIHGARSAGDLIVAADIALYEAKRAGRDRVVFSQGPADERVEWVSKVREAVEQGHLAAYAQPIVDLGTGELVAEELLVRMLGEDGAPIAAGSFVPTAERFGLIRTIDRWVVERAVEAVAAGRTINVNVSAASVADPELTEIVERAFIRAPGADRSRLTFEITETGATPSIEILRAFSARVGELGCSLALDDVGTGFGSLIYLQNLQFGQIKIDMQFVQGICGSPIDEGIVRSLVTIARELGLKTVGEGVESEAVRRRLGELGVDFAQGYFLGTPQPLFGDPDAGPAEPRADS